MNLRQFIKGHWSALIGGCLVLLLEVIQETGYVMNNDEKHFEHNDADCFNVRVPLPGAPGRIFHVGLVLNQVEECPELRIIEPEVFEKAQELRDARRREKGEDADSYSPHALLCGKVFCAHCGNRLNITSSGRTRLRADGTVVKEKRYRYSCNFNVRHPGQCDGQSGYGVTTLDAVVESIVCMKFEEILECSKSNLLEEMRRKDLDAAKKEATRWKEEVQTKVDEQDALKKEMIRVIQGTSGLDREMIQQMVNENKEALLTGTMSSMKQK